jgi:hypothetical protein
MKKMFIVLSLCLFLLVSCVTDKKETDISQQRDSVLLENLTSDYVIDDFIDYDIRALIIRTSALKNALRDSNTYALVIGETEFRLEQNPFNQEQSIAFMPSSFSSEAIRAASVKTSFTESRTLPRDPDALIIEKVWLEKGEQNGSDLYEMTLITYINMKTAPHAFVYVDGNTDGTLIRPAFVKNNDENAYTFQRYINARQVTTNHTATEAFNFLRTQADYTSLIDFANPNRVADDGTVIPPDSRDRMRELDGFGPVTVDGTYTWHFLDNGTDQIILSLKQSNLPTDAYRKSELLRVQIKDIATQTFVETTPDSGLFETVVAYTTTESTEIILNARFMATPPSTSTDFRLKAGNGIEARLDATGDATELKVASGTTIAQIKSRIESVDGSAQVYTFTGQSGELTDETVLEPTSVATITVQSRNGEMLDFEIVTNRTPFIRLEKPVQLLSTRLKDRSSGGISWHDTINDALTAASQDSTITVWEGEYYEAIMLFTDVVLQSATPSDATVRDNTILYGNSPDRAVWVNNTTTAKLQGFTIVPNLNLFPSDFAAVEIEPQAYVEITNNRIKDCHVGIRINEATGEETGVVYLHDNILEDNNGTEYGAIFVGDGRIAKIVNNIIQNNNATGGSGGITVDEGGRIQNADDAFWLANLLPGTAQTAAEVEGVVQTNTFSGNSVNLNTSADGKDVFYTRSTAPTAENIEAHASLDTVTVTADYTVGDIVRVYTAADATTEVASATYSGPPTGSRGVDTVTVNYDVQADTNYYVSVQGDIYKYAESTRTEKLSINGPDAPTLSSPSNGASNQTRIPTLSWSAAARASSYNVYFGTSSGSLAKVTSGITGTTYTTDALNAETTYYWRIESVDGNDLTKSSAEWSFTTNSDIFVSGNGTSGSPYGIADWRALHEIRNQGNDSYFELLKDIDSSSSGYASYGGSSANGGSGWEPIAKNLSFDGNGYKIKDLYINRPSEFNVGFFRLISHSTIKNLGLENVNITGGSNTGGLAAGLGYPSSMENCYVTGSVSGTESVGGLSGSINGGNSSQQIDVKNSYSTAAVSATGNYSGGICGLSSYVIFTNCYTSGHVSGTRTGAFVANGGFNSTFNSCYWNTETSGQSVAGYTTNFGDGTLPIPGLSSTNMKQAVNFSGWDFTNIWTIDEGSTFPYLKNVTPTTKPGQ